MTDLEVIGAKVLEALARGREQRLAKRRARALELRELVERAARLDRAAGKPDRGRAGRVARRLQLTGVALSERWVREILSELTDTGAASSSASVVSSPQVQPVRQP